MRIAVVSTIRTAVREHGDKVDELGIEILAGVPGSSGERDVWHRVEQHVVLLLGPEVPFWSQQSQFSPSPPKAHQSAHNVKHQATQSRSQDAARW